jgi:hypothetical protein
MSMPASQNIHIPDRGAVDDRGTMDSQLPGTAKASTVPRVIAAQIHKYLEDVNYPATKDELYLHAASRGAPLNTLNHLRTMRRSCYDSAADVDNELRNATSHD